jgi:hypothetical protein
MEFTEQMQREVLAIVNLPSELPAGWSKFLQSLKGRELVKTDLILASGFNR